MAVCASNKLDSNLVGLAFAEEDCPKILPATPVWHAAEPNSFPDFGGQITTVARDPINPSRQRLKGAVTDMSATGGWNTDLTSRNFKRLSQGFVCADMIEQAQTDPLNPGGTNTALTITSVASATGYAAASGLNRFTTNDLVFAENFGQAGNNGLKVATTAGPGALNVTPACVAEASPPANARLTRVGRQFAAGTLTITVSGPLISLGGTALDTLGLQPGDWIFVGGDTAVTQFNNGAYGFARVGSVSATAIVLDKVSWKSVTADTGAGKTIQLFFANIAKNQNDPTKIVRRTYQLERSLTRASGAAMDQCEYLTGASANQFTLNLKQATKVDVDLAFIGIDTEQRNSALGPKAGTRRSVVTEDMFNTSSDLVRVALTPVDATNSKPTSFFGFATEATITINNNVTPNKALGVLGAMDTSLGTFEVGGTVQAYFTTVDAVAAVKQNADVTFDVALVKKNRGVVFDLPLVGLGNGRVNVTKDQPIMLPVDTLAYKSAFGHTLLIAFFDYLPTLATTPSP